MLNNFIRRIAPNPEKVRSHKSLRRLAPLLKDPNFFYFNRHSVSRACAIGFGIGLTPIYGHTFVAVLLAIYFRANVPLSLIIIWVGNPLSLPFIILGQYWVGALLLGIEDRLTLASLSQAEWQYLLNEAWLPILVGALSTCLIAAFLSYLLVQWFWKMRVSQKWKARIQQRRQAAKSAFFTDD